jgi:hypothetical protein
MRPELEKLQACLHTVFAAHTAAGTVELKLDKVTELPRGGLPESLPTPLNLTLTGPTAPLLGDAQYYLDHPVLGRQLWYLSAFSHAPFLPGLLPGEEKKQLYQVLFT